MPMTAASENLSELVTVALPKAELYLCLGQLFEPRTRALPLTQWEALLDDFHALGSELAVPDVDWLQGFAQCLQSLESAEQALVEYTRLFLMPPAPAPLNLGYYRDGGQMGQTGTHLAEMYQRDGLQRSADFHDLDDHLALNLQWLAWRWASIAEHKTLDSSEMENLAMVVERYSLPACRQLVSDVHKLEQKGRVSALWPQLVRLLKDSLAADQALLAAYRPEQETEANEVPKFEPAPVAAPRQPLLSLDCRSCGRKFEADDALSNMIRQLQNAGLDTSHLEACTDCRHPDRQPATLTPPGARRFAPRQTNRKPES